ncbi:hypothetical protein EDD86DRAFT_217807 [Gorgonomyces haynaldii]|nr:hypothetical protein EDD86DRAFT_217807 [Gorgonomyces haynaldii]
MTEIRKSGKAHHTISDTLLQMALSNNTVHAAHLVKNRLATSEIDMNQLKEMQDTVQSLPQIAKKKRTARSILKVCKHNYHSKTIGSGPVLASSKDSMESNLGSVLVFDSDYFDESTDSENSLTDATSFRSKTPWDE